MLRLATKQNATRTPTCYFYLYKNIAYLRRASDFVLESIDYETKLNRPFFPSALFNERLVQRHLYKHSLSNVAIVYFQIKQTLNKPFFKRLVHVNFWSVVHTFECLRSIIFVYFPGYYPKQSNSIPGGHKLCASIFSSVRRGKQLKSC